MRCYRHGHLVVEIDPEQLDWSAIGVYGRDNHGLFLARVKHDTVCVAPSMQRSLAVQQRVIHLVDQRLQLEKSKIIM